MANKVFTKENNIVEKFDEGDLRTIAQSYGAKRWRWATDTIREAIDNSNFAWNHCLKGRPVPEDKVSLKEKRDISTYDSGKNKGLRLGVINQVVTSLLALQHSASFPNDDRFFKGVPKNEFAQKNQDLYESYMSENFGQATIDYKFWLHRFNTIVDGTALSAVHWVQKKRKKKVYKKNTLSIPTFPGAPSIKIDWPGIKSSVKEVIEWEGTELEPLTFDEWRVDPYAASLEDSWVLRRWYKPTYDVEEEYGLEEGSVDSYHKEIENFDDEDGPQSTKNEAVGITDLVSSGLENEPDGKQNCLLMSVYDDFIINGKVYKNHVAIILNDCKVIHFGPNPYDHGLKPFILTPYLPIPGELYGLSAIAPILPMAKAIDSMVNTTIRGGAMATEPIYLVNLNEPAFQKNIEIEFGQTIPVKNLANAIAPVPLPIPNVQFAQTMIPMLQKYIEDTLGLNSVISGQTPQQSGVTALEISQRSEASSMKFQSLLKNFENMGIEPFMRMVHSNNQQYKEREEFIQGYDKELLPDDIKLMEFNWILSSGKAIQDTNRQLGIWNQFLSQMLPLGLQAGVMEVKQGKTEVDIGGITMQMLQDSGLKTVNQYLKTKTEEELQEELMGQEEEIPNESGQVQENQGIEGEGELPPPQAVQPGGVPIPEGMGA